MPLLFCYGSNHPKQLEERIGPPRSVAPAYTAEYKRVFRGWSHNWGGGVANLVRTTPRDARPCYGYVADVTAAQLDQMDLYEGVGRGVYTRRTIDVIVNGKKKKSIAYIRSVDDGVTSKPSKAYLAAVAKTIGSFWKISGVKDITIE